MRTGLAFLYLAAVGLAGAWSLETAAQTVEGVEAGRLRAEAKKQAGDAQLFADEVRRRGEAVRAEALQAREAAMRNRMPVAIGPKPSGGALDFDQMVADAGRLADGSKANPGPRFIAFASMAMPVGSLRALIRDVGAAGGVVVFRGLPHNSAKVFMSSMAKIVDKGQKTSGIGIDPRLFRAFRITAVPTYVVTTSDVDLCDGFSCTTPLPPHDRLAGNVTAGYALERFAGGGGPGAAASKVFARRLSSARKE
jgi:conjugal transfer pilus assembly protein TrbC